MLAACVERIYGNELSATLRLPARSTAIAPDGMRPCANISPDWLSLPVEELTGRLGRIGRPDILKCIAALPRLHRSSGRVAADLDWTMVAADLDRTRVAADLDRTRMAADPERTRVAGDSERTRSESGCKLGADEGGCRLGPDEGGCRLGPDESGCRLRVAEIGCRLRVHKSGCKHPMVKHGYQLRQRLSGSKRKNSCIQ